MAGKGGKSQFSARHAFKVLCPDTLVSSVIGPRGTTKDELQAETGCKIVVSNREEFYPGTRLRMLIIYGDNPQGLVQCLGRVVHNVGQCAEKEQEMGVSPLESEFSGKEAGEFMLWAAIPTKASGAIIGPKGVNIQAIRNDFNARVFIEKSIEQGHQALKLVASLDNMRHALLRINEAVQEEARTSEHFRDWAALRHFGEAGAALQEAAGVSHKGGDYGKGSAKLPKGGGKRRERSRSPRRGDGGQQSMLKALAAAMAEVPEGARDEEFVLQCDLPRAKVSALIGKSGDHVRSVRKETRTKVNFDEAPGQDTQTMTIKGRMMDVYRAHSMMMRRYHDEDKEAQVDVQKAARVNDLQAQLAEIQKQLSMVAGGKGKGGKGKR